MKKHTNDADGHDEVGKGAEEFNEVDDPIKASDSKRNDERDKRISEEKGTKRIRSEGQSIKEAQKNRHRPLL